MDSRTSLEILEERLEQLERKVYGTGGQANFDINYDVSGWLSSYGSRLANLVSGRDRTEVAMRRIEEIDRCLAASLGAGPGDPDPDAQLALVLEAEPRLRHQVDCLERLTALSPVLESEHLRGTPSLTGRLKENASVQAAQAERQQRVAEQTQQLLQAYHQLTASLNSKLVAWDRDVTQSELKKIAANAPPKE